MYIVGLIVGIIGLMGVVPFIGGVMIPINVAAVTIGIVGVKKKDLILAGEHQMALAALILGAIPLAIQVLTFLALLSGGL